MEPSIKHPPPPDPTPRHRFRWNLIGIVIATLLFLYFLNNAQPAFAFADLMDFLSVQDTDRFRRYFTLGCICVAIAAVWRILGKRRNDET